MIVNFDSGISSLPSAAPRAARYPSHSGQLRHQVHHSVAAVRSVRRVWCFQVDTADSAALGTSERKVAPGSAREYKQSGGNCAGRGHHLARFGKLSRIPIPTEPSLRATTVHSNDKLMKPSFSLGRFLRFYTCSPRNKQLSMCVVLRITPRFHKVERKVSLRPLRRCS